MLRLKRVLDIVVSSVGLLVFGIPLVVIAAAIKLDSRGPVFFRQERVGKGWVSFKIFKFRSMADGSERTGLNFSTGPNENRITRVGRLIRRFSLDEVPQLINVLKGDMSLVGPRPAPHYQVEEYDEHQSRRLAMKPGMTSYASVNGRNALLWKHRLELDVWYVENWYFWLDLRILAKTLWVAFVTCEGLYGDERVNDDFLAIFPQQTSEGTSGSGPEMSVRTRGD